jgi:hypothetical protein
MMEHLFTLGFKPAFVMIKRTDSTGSWPIEDSARSPSNSSMQSIIFKFE